MFKYLKIGTLMHLLFCLFSSSFALDCPPGWVDAADTCFLLVNSQKLSWIDAQQYCQSLGGHLAEPLTEDWSNLLTSIASIETDVLGVESWWIGLSDLGHEGRWIWQNYLQEADYTNWAVDYPTSGDVEKNCVTMTAQNDLQWSDELCTSTRASPICQTGSIQTSSPQPPTIPTSTPTSLVLVQLVGGEDNTCGNVMALNWRGEFGPICDDNWGPNDAPVVCGQLGFSRENFTVYKYSHFGAVSDDFAMDTIVCDGTEERIQDCAYDTEDDCKRGEGAGVCCSPL